MATNSPSYGLGNFDDKFSPQSSRAAFARSGFETIGPKLPGKLR
jgi:hypothetical protein